MSFLTLFLILMALLCDKTNAGFDFFYCCCWMLKPMYCVFYCYMLVSSPIHVWLLVVRPSYFLLIWGNLFWDDDWPLLICFILANLAWDQFYPRVIWTSSFESELFRAMESSMGLSIAWVYDLLSFLFNRCLFYCFINWLLSIEWPNEEDLGLLRIFRKESHWLLGGEFENLLLKVDCTFCNR